ncbi:hypothetical protein Tco_1005398 [Tanacetum coccineum]|uniref:Uncharacterized protein n=1 Tax=Tanacetum coccineum TaxID=301880 RepID=A0ABQ5FEW2_9ASTR
METQKPLLKDEDGEEVDVHMYRSMIGSLMYLTSSRPDIMFAVCACARYQVNLKVSHLYAVKRIFRYLKGQPKLGLWYPKDSPFDLIAYTDSDYAGASLDRKSTTRGCQFLGCRLISWQCKKQTVVANSTTEAEYVAASSCYGQVTFLSKSTKSDGFKQILDFLNAHPIRKPKRKDTQIPQSSDPSNNVVDKAVHKELGDSLVRAATTASRLEAKQDSDEEFTLVSVHDINVSAAGYGVWKQIDMPYWELVNAFSCEVLAQIRRISLAGYGNMEGYKLNDLKLKYFDSIQEMFDRAFKRVNTFEDFRTELVEGREKRAGTELAQEITKKQKVDNDKETTKIKKLMEIIPDEEEVAIDAIPLAFKSPSIIDWKIHKEGRKSYYQIIRADGKSQMYMIFSHMLKSFDRENLETLYKLVKAKYES